MFNIWSKERQLAVYKEINEIKNRPDYKDMLEIGLYTPEELSKQKLAPKADKVLIIDGLSAVPKSKELTQCLENFIENDISIVLIRWKEIEFGEFARKELWDLGRDFIEFIICHRKDLNNYEKEKTKLLKSCVDYFHTNTDNTNTDDKNTRFVVFARDDKYYTDHLIAKKLGIYPVCISVSDKRDEKAFNQFCLEKLQLVSAQLNKKYKLFHEDVNKITDTFIKDAHSAQVKRLNELEVEIKKTTLKI